jgi:6-pyruvoyltetrahydropterin/6-carboxytetrahydropterin synthase
MFELSIKSKFSSAHFLREYEGKCENLHGHNWKVELILRGKELNKIGLLVDFKEMKNTLNTVLDELDHKLINENEFFKTKNPSCENIAFYLHQILSQKFNTEKINVHKVIVFETDDASASYFEIPSLQKE